MSERALKKEYFKKKLEGVTRMIWDVEFSMSKLKSLREDIRVQYDRSKEASRVFEGRLEMEKAKEQKDEKLIEQLASEIEKHKPDLAQMESQMGQLDNEMNGPDNPQSVHSKLEALHELKAMLLDYAKKL